MSMKKFLVPLSTVLFGSFMFSQTVSAHMQVEQGVVTLNKNKISKLMNPNGCEANRGVLNGRVDFKKSFAQPPAVMLGITQLDMIDGSNHRITVSATKVDKTGFTYNFLTWCDTKVWSANAQWIAIGQKSRANLVINGSFEQPALGSGWKPFKSIPGWTVGVGQIEVQHGVAGKPQHKKQLVELDANNSSAIYQDINTKAGETYRLRFHFSARPGTAAGDNKLQVLWGGTVIAILDAGAGGGNTAWKKHGYTVTANSDKTRLEFKDVGISNGLGTYIDNISVRVK